MSVTTKQCEDHRDDIKELIVKCVSWRTFSLTLLISAGIFAYFFIATNSTSRATTRIEAVQQTIREDVRDIKDIVQNGRHE